MRTKREIIEREGGDVEGKDGVRHTFSARFSAIVFLCLRTPLLSQRVKPYVSVRKRGREETEGREEKIPDV